MSIRKPLIAGKSKTSEYALGPVLETPGRVSGAVFNGEQLSKDAAPTFSGIEPITVSQVWMEEDAVLTGEISDALTVSNGAKQHFLAFIAEDGLGRVQTYRSNILRPLAAPSMVRGLRDHIFRQLNGPGEVSTAAAFSGSHLTFSVEGQGASIDPATGVVTHSDVDSHDWRTITVTASNLAGSTQATYRVYTTLGENIPIEHTITTTWTITDPPEYAGVYVTTLADVETGPHTLVQPTTTGTTDQGDTVTVVGGLYASSPSGGDLAVTWQWRRGGVDIPGETEPTHEVTADDIAEGLSVIETATNLDGVQHETVVVIP